MKSKAKILATSKKIKQMFMATEKPLVLVYLNRIKTFGQSERRE
jgi:hypothetical protein